MSAPQQQRRNQVKIARLEIVAKLYKRGYSRRQIRREVMTRLALASYSVATVQHDIQTLLAEWRENRIEDMDDALQLELARIDETCRELWGQWEKSKEDYTKTSRRQSGTPARNTRTGETSIRTTLTTRAETEVVGLGNPAYIAEIRQQLAERRKLLGLYAPEKRDVSGNMSFASFLMESGLLEEAEKGAGE